VLEVRDHQDAVARGDAEPLKALLRRCTLDGLPLEGGGLAGREVESLQQGLHLARGGAKVGACYA
jgi:hypothetical protein